MPHRTAIAVPSTAEGIDPTFTGPRVEGFGAFHFEKYDVHPSPGGADRDHNGGVAGALAGFDLGFRNLVVGDVCAPRPDLAAGHCVRPEREIEAGRRIGFKEATSSATARWFTLSAHPEPGRLLPEKRIAVRKTFCLRSNRSASRRSRWRMHGRSTQRCRSPSAQARRPGLSAPFSPWANAARAQDCLAAAAFFEAGYDAQEERAVAWSCSTASTTRHSPKRCAESCSRAPSDTPLPIHLYVHLRRRDARRAPSWGKSAARSLRWACSPACSGRPTMEHHRLRRNCAERTALSRALHGQRPRSVPDQAACRRCGCISVAGERPVC